jgi:protein HIRA/HIR1
MIRKFDLTQSLLAGIPLILSIRAARGRAFGSDEVNVEGWKALKRLPGHDSGSLRCPNTRSSLPLSYSRCHGLGLVSWGSLSSLSWARLAGSYLVWIYPWCDTSIAFQVLGADQFPERIRKLDQHQGFVKGVCWDPVGEFLATQSDDRTVKIWRTTDWQLEAEVSKPFEDSPGSTFFRRLRWPIFHFLP